MEFDNVTGFDWDSDNNTKNYYKHQVTQVESEQIFFNQPLIIEQDNKNSHSEKRYYGLGQTDIGRKLFVVFTIRKSLIRIISARDMNKRERGAYDQKRNP